MSVNLQNHQVLTCFKVSQKVLLTHKLFVLENARNVLNKQLDNLTKKAYEEVHGFIKSSSPTGSFTNLLERLDAKCQAIERLSDVLNDLKLAPVQDVVRWDAGTLQKKPAEERSTFKNMFITSVVGKAVHVLGARLHFQHLKHLVLPQKCTVRDDKVKLSQTVTADVQDATCSASPSHSSPGQDTEILGKTEQTNVEKSLEEVLSPASGDVVESKAHKVLLPTIPAIPQETSSSSPYLGVPMTKWGREDDFQEQYQKQSPSELLNFLLVKTKTTDVLNATVKPSYNSFSGLPLPSPTKNITKQTLQIKQDAAWPPGLLSETENFPPLFKVKRVNASGSLTYSCVIATKTELWDIADIETESESDSVSSEETAQIMPSDETHKSIDPSVQKDEATNMKMHTVSEIIIPEFQIKRFEESEVVVSHIVNPGCFYIQHTDANEKLHSLSSDSWEQRSTLAEQNCIPDIGTKVMGWFPQEKQWCRSQVTKICGVSKDEMDSSTKMSIGLEVRRLDYGDSSCLSLSNIKEMTSEMAGLPLQAVQVSLAHVSPLSGTDWSEEAVDWFRHMVHKRTLYARLYPEGHRILVDLFLEKGKIQAMRRGASLSLRLTQNGHAAHAKLRGVGTVKLKMKKKDLEWEKYLISWYTQNHLHRAVL